MPLQGQGVWSPRFIAAALILALPSVVVLALLAILTELSAMAAIMGAAAAVFFTFLLLRPLFNGLRSVRSGLDEMADNAEAMPALRSASPLAHEVWAAAIRLARASRQRLKVREADLVSARAVLSALPDPLLLLDEKRRIVSANPAATELLGPRLADRDLAAALRNPAVLAGVGAVLAGEAGRVVEFDLPGSVERHLSARIAPLNPRTPEGAAAVLTLSDFTALKRSEQMRADFVANSSHELRTPLASLIGFIETLRGPAADDPQAQARFLAIMAEQAGRMARLVDDLLSLSRIEMNEHMPPTGQVDLASVLASIADALEQRAASRGMRIELKFPAIMPRVAGDADELSQVFQNLLDNAIKYGRLNTSIEVQVSHSSRILPGRPSVLAVAVRDHGEGIAREHLPRLTERFYRVDVARSRDLGGTGLGLAIVEHIINRHRGYLEIDSEVGKGSIFTVYLPVAPLFYADVTNP